MSISTTEATKDENTINISIEEYNRLKAQSSEIKTYQTKLQDNESRYAGLATEYEDFKTKKSPKLPSREELEAEVRREYGEKFSQNENQLKDLQGKLKNLSVTDKVLSKLNGKVIPSALKFLRSEIERECDIEGDIYEGQVIVKDDSGNVRWSPNQADKKMDVDEYVNLLSSRYSDFFLSTAREGEKDNTAKKFTTDSTNSNLSFSDISRMTQAELDKVDPAVLKKLI